VPHRQAQICTKKDISRHEIDTRQGTIMSRKYDPDYTSTHDGLTDCHDAPSVIIVNDDETEFPICSKCGAVVVETPWSS
jgi:hypothetical protein